MQNEVDQLKQQVESLEKQVQAMRHCLRELKIRIAYIGMPQEPFWMDGDRKIWDWRKQIALLEETLLDTTAGRA